MNKGHELMIHKIRIAKQLTNIEKNMQIPV